MQAWPNVSEVSLDNFFADHLLDDWKALDPATRKKLTADTKTKVKTAKKHASSSHFPIIPNEPKRVDSKQKVEGPLRNVGPNMQSINRPMTRSQSKSKSSQ